MNEPTGPPMASGRAADVFDQGDGTVLRRYRSNRDTELEARVMTWVRARGVPVPTVHDARGRDLVMDLVLGPTVLEDLERRPWMMLPHARTLARLQRQVNELAAPDWMPSLSDVSTGSSVVHLDLHPMNVMLGSDGPMIIDWTNAGRGEAWFDAALSFVLMSTFEVSGVRDRIGQRIFTAAFARARGRKELKRSIADACTYRLSDKNITAEERAAVQTLLANQPP